MNYNNGKNFSTKDRDHDTSGNNCAAQDGAWWHGWCSNSKLNYDMNSNKLYWGGFKYIHSTMMIKTIT